MNKFIRFIFLISLLIAGCNNDDILSKEKKWIEIGKYQIEVPSNFQLNSRQGYDSYVGDIAGSGISISFDYGAYTSPLKNDPPENFDLKNDSIDGHFRQILIAKNPKINQTSMRIIEQGANPANQFSALSLKLYSKKLTPTQQELVLQIYESVMEKP